MAHLACLQYRRCIEQLLGNDAAESHVVSNLLRGDFWGSFKCLTSDRLREETNCFTLNSGLTTGMQSSSWSLLLRMRWVSEFTWLSPRYVCRCPQRDKSTFDCLAVFLQHPAVAVFTCLGAACCALGIALVWQNHWNLRNTYRSSEGSRIKGSPFKIDRNRNILPPIDGPNYISTQLKGVTVAKPIIYMDEESKLGTEGATKGSHENGILTNYASAFETKQQEDSRIIDFIDALEHLEKLPDSAPSSSVPLGEIAHMRCSPDGRWVAVCYKRACIVYDMEVSDPKFEGRLFLIGFTE